MDKNSTSNGIITRVVDFYEWTLSLSGNDCTTFSRSEFKVKTLKSIKWIFFCCFCEITDGRTKGMLFVDSPTPTILLTLVYLFSVWIGPKIMKK